MDETIAAEIAQIRTRLGEISDEREHLSGDNTKRDELLDEEHQLEVRLSELEDRIVAEDTGEAEKEAAAQTDITRSPRLPDTDPNTGMTEHNGSSR